jgi:hypothetical protein
VSKNPRQSKVLRKAYTEKFPLIAPLVADCYPLEFEQIKHTFGVPEKVATDVEPKFEDYFPKAYSRYDTHVTRQPLWNSEDSLGPYKELSPELGS